MYTSKIFVTVDNVVIRKNNDIIEILLIKRLNEPFKHFWALPGGFVDEHEDLETAAKRELYEETGIQVFKINQIGAYGTPYRDPRSHVISIAYSSEVDFYTVAVAADDALEVKWFNLFELPPTAFDHAQIIRDFIEQNNMH